MMWMSSLWTLYILERYGPFRPNFRLWSMTFWDNFVNCSALMLSNTITLSTVYDKCKANKWDFSFEFEATTDTADGLRGTGYTSEQIFKPTKGAMCEIVVLNFKATAIQRIFFTNYFMPASSRRMINRWFQNDFWFGTHPHLGEKGRSSIKAAKRNQIKNMFHTDPRCSLPEAATVLGVHHTSVHHYLREKLKMFPYRLPIGQKVSNAD